MALPFALRRNPRRYEVMLLMSSTSAATSVQLEHALRAARKYCAARFGLRLIGWETWLASFHTPSVFTNG